MPGVGVAVSRYTSRSARFSPAIVVAQSCRARRAATASGCAHEVVSRVPTDSKATHACKQDTTRNVYSVGSSLDVVASASIQDTPMQPSSSGQRIICRVGKPSAFSVAPTSSLELRLPAGVHFPHGGMGAARQKLPWLHAHPVAADPGALAAWGVPDLPSLAHALKALAERDPGFPAALAAAAFAVAAPLGAASPTSAAAGARASSVAYSCSAKEATFGSWGSIQVSGIYVRDPEDGTLSPAVLLELRGLAQAQPARDLDSAGPASAAAGPAPAMALEAAAPAPGSQHRRVQRGLMRAGAVLTAAPYITTFMELDLAPWATPPEPPKLERPKSLRFAPAAPAAPKSLPGRVLLQNEESLHYWGKLTPKNPTGSWQVLMHLLQNNATAPTDLLTHLREQRLQTADSHGQVTHVLVGTPWKKVVKVASHSHGFGRMLREQARQQQAQQQQQQQQPGTGAAAAGAAAQQPHPNPHAAVLSALVGTGTGLGRPLHQQQGSDASAMVVAAPLPPLAPAPQPPHEQQQQQRQRQASSALASSRPSPSRPSRPEEGALALMPSKVMSIMTAVSGPVLSKQNSQSGRAAYRTTSINSSSPSARASGVAFAAAAALAQTQQGEMSPHKPAGGEELAVAVPRRSARSGSATSAVSRFSPPGSTVGGSGGLLWVGGEEEEEEDSDEEGSGGGSGGQQQGLNCIHEDSEEDPDDERYHEVQVIPLHDPVSGREAVLVIQTDITSRHVMEQRIATLTESQLKMLEGMFPRHVLEFVMSPTVSFDDLGSLAFSHQKTTILFMDVVGFTSMSKEVAPQKVMDFLNTLFRRFDNMCDVYDVYKVETAGDCYIVAGALMKYDDEGFVALDKVPDSRKGAKNVLEFAQAMLRHARTVIMPHNGQPTSVRVGIHTGDITSGLIGTRLPKFGLFGDTMNTSSRMESTGRPGCVQISEATYAMLSDKDRAMFEASGGIEVKGKGHMPTWIWTPTEEDLRLRLGDLDAACGDSTLATAAPTTSAPSRRASAVVVLPSLGPSAPPSPGLAGPSPAASQLHGSSSVPMPPTMAGDESPSGPPLLSQESGRSSSKRAQWNLVRNVVKVVEANKMNSVRSRLTQIASGAKSSPALIAQQHLLEQQQREEEAEEEQEEQARPRRREGASSAAAGDGGGSAAAAAAAPIEGSGGANIAPLLRPKKQNSIFIMKEMLALMQATAEEAEQG